MTFKSVTTSIGWFPLERNLQGPARIWRELRHPGHFWLWWAHHNCLPFIFKKCQILTNSNEVAKWLMVSRYPSKLPSSILIHCNQWKFRSHKSHLWNSIPRWLKHSCTMNIYKLKINEETCLKIDSSYPRVWKCFEMHKETTWLCSLPQWQISCITSKITTVELTSQCVAYLSCIATAYLKKY